MSAKMEEVDESLYSRQLYILGYEGMKLMMQNNVLISGLGGLGVEVAKNLILAGVKSVTLHDCKLCSWHDLSNQFLLSDKELGQNRALGCVEKLRELNQYVEVNALTDTELTANVMKKFHVIVLTDHTFNEQVRISRITHSLKIKLVIGEVRGLCYKIFCDFGESFTVADLDGEPQTTHLVGGITQAKEGVVALVDDEKHGLQDGDFVTFSEIKGMTELNECEPIPVKVLSPDSFIIGDTTNFTPYIDGGIMRQVKIPTVLKFESFENALYSLYIQNINGLPEGRALQLHVAFIVTHIYMEDRKRLPRPWNLRDASDFIQKFRSYASLLDANVNVESQFILKFSKTCAGNFAPISAIAGGIIAQEVIKACSAKFVPIRQWQYFDAFDCIPENDVIINASLKSESRYIGQLAIFGEGIQYQIESLKYFVVGLGGIGCEVLKNFALMGVGTSPEGKVIISDMDIIEKSNLNRQFLYRLPDILLEKSTIAHIALKNINPRMNIISHVNKIGPETENIYNCEFYTKLDGIISSLDNFESRVYLDRQSVYYRKPLIVCGSLGTKGSTQVIVPFLTESYCNSRDPPEKNFPLCTLKSFPNSIEHTIIWARDLFDNIFYEKVETAASFLKDTEGFKTRLQQSNDLDIELVASIKRIMQDERPANFDDCVVWARLQWQELFHNQIRQLLSCFPPDQVSASGQLFWSGPKKCPMALDFDENDQLNLDFIVAAANLRAQVYNIDQNSDRKTIIKMLQKISIPEFSFRGCRETDNDKYISDFKAKVTNKAALLNVVESLLMNNEINFKPLIFEKDDNYNFNIDFITSAANLRARNYKIPPTDHLNAKFIAGKIVPAIATTTSVAGGLACLEVVKLTQLFSDIEVYRNSFFNLALPLLAISEPLYAPRNKFYDFEWNLWHRFDIEGELTLNEFLEYFRNTWKLKVNMITFGVCVLYANFTDKALREERGILTMSQLCEQVCNRKVESHQTALVFEICCSTIDEQDVDVPYVNYIISVRGGTKSCFRKTVRIETPE